MKHINNNNNNKKLKYEAKHRLKNKAPLYLNLLPKIFHIKTI